MARGKLYYGDNLDWMKMWPDESVDLVYLDPPFNSKASYNILWEKEARNGAPAQVLAFEDTWHWVNPRTRSSQAAERNFDAALAVGGQLARYMQAMMQLHGPCGLLAYLAHLAPRLAEMHRLLKPTGSIYLHCDPSAGYYIRTLLDAIFGPKNFRNEIVWCYAGPSFVKRWFPRKHDTILFYAKSDEAFFDLPLAEHKSGLHNKGTVFGKRDGDEAAVRKREAEGKSLEDWWTDIGAGGHMPRKERLGYPTQKPEALLRRILQASSREGDMVLDPYCGCGTTIHVAEQLGRNYMGVDITHYAIEIIEFRFRSKLLMPPPPVEGRPADLGGARELFARSPFQFEAWAIGRCGAGRIQPNERKVGDRGIDGRAYFADGSERHLLVAQVKGGRNIGPGAVRDLKGVMQRENAKLGILVGMERSITKGVARELSAGSVQVGRESYPKLQYWSIEDYFEGGRPRLPALIGRHERDQVTMEHGGAD